MAVSSNLNQFYKENKGNQFFELVRVFFSSTMEMNDSKQHPIVPFTLSTRFNDLVLTLAIYRTTNLPDKNEIFARVTIFLRTSICNIIF